MTSKGNKPLGVTSYNIEIQDMEDIQELAKMMAMIEEIHVESVNIQIVEECAAGDIESSNGSVKYRIGDFVAKHAMAVLELMCPYPGDTLEALAANESRFLVYQIEGGKHIVMDQELCEDDFIEMHLLFNANFNLPLWYAQHCVQALEIELDKDNSWNKSLKMDLVLEWGILTTLKASE